MAENFWLIDQFAAGPFGSVIDVNGSPVTNPNFNNTTPAAPSGNVNVTWQVSGGNISAYVPNASPGGSNLDFSITTLGYLVVLVELRFLILVVLLLQSFNSRRLNHWRTIFTY